jgi:SAM-dependent methyltransferase
MSLLSTLLAEERQAQAGHDYLAYHRERFDYVMEKCRELCSDPAAEVLDIGRSDLSRRLLKVYGRVTTLGLPLSDHEQFGHEAGLGAADGKSYAGHIVFDLNDAQTVEQIDTQRKFDLIVFAETIEHLYTAPELVLGLLATLLAPGGMIICQTPNASALQRRIMMLLGRNPYERLRIDAGNRGHIREYTRAELVMIGQRAGLETVWHEYRNYFGVQGGWAKKVTQKMVAALYPPLARGQTIVYKRALDV